jgi:hypothetical protein
VVGAASLLACGLGIWDNAAGALRDGHITEIGWQIGALLAGMALFVALATLVAASNRPTEERAAER